MNPVLAQSIRAARVAHLDRPCPPRRVKVPAACAKLPWARPSIAPASLSLAALLRVIAKDHGVTVADMQSTTRRHQVAHARWEFYYRAMAQSLISTVMIGARLNQDHASVMYGAGRHCMVHGLPAPRGVDLAATAARKKERNRQRNGAASPSGMTEQEG